MKNPVTVTIGGAAADVLWAGLVGPGLYQINVQVPANLDDARAVWEQDPWDREAKAWRETKGSIEWRVQQVVQLGGSIEGWHGAHPVQSLLIRAGFQSPPPDLEQLARKYVESVRFLQGSQAKLVELEQAWVKKEPGYRQQLEQQGWEIQKARDRLGIIGQNPEHSGKSSNAKTRCSGKRPQPKREQERHHGRDRGGWDR